MKSKIIRGIVAVMFIMFFLSAYTYAQIRIDGSTGVMSGLNEIDMDTSTLEVKIRLGHGNMLISNSTGLYLIGNTATLKIE